MAKKRKASGRAPAQPKSFDEIDPSQSKLRINSYEDVADSEDEFHLNQDKVLLDEGPQAKRRRRLAEEDEFLQASDEEVLAYDDESSDVDEYDDEGEEGMLEPRNGNYTSKPGLRDGLRDTPEDDEDGEDLHHWGKNKESYYDADVIETEQDALDEEAEALRLQKKHLEALDDADYGFDESTWKLAGKEEKAVLGAGVVTEVLPDITVTDDMGPTERLKLLKARYPEFEYLAQEWNDLRRIRPTLAAEAKAAQKAKSNIQRNDTPFAVTAFRTADSYLAALTMYFVILTSPAAKEDAALARSPVEMREHGIMDMLMRCRDLWLKVKEMEVSIPSSPAVGDMATEYLSDHSSSPLVSPSIPNGQLLSELEDAESRGTEKRDGKPKKRVIDEQAAEATRRTQARIAEMNKFLASASQNPLIPVASTQKDGYDIESDDDIGEPAPLTEAEAKEKARKRKSLRFYTSQIAQRELKKDRAGQGQGDDDLPYRERWRDRVERLNKEAETRGKKKAEGKEVLGAESGSEDEAEASRSAIDDEDDYYDYIANRNKKKKDDKAMAAMQVKADKLNAQVVPVEVVGPDGKRKITYQIEKNKGLAPKRKKDVRNPRVKKRKKYEERQKKLKSIKSVFTSGEARGGYGGELTGIKRGLVKSRKL
ncbi:hypothetical protein P152DRAFT_21995 [Eremomyces bilateralis CBS 781.70]|uniref:Sas10 C-terminal domain-containing protein n=1 Tax=Eremomyces bilateralis CBS 781.70 TaxID=1392243 RepID=A0A6G1GI00_9PEZI|nr:uncharacterized protein P152DRAFT_21995 [Eremomyces bilateralis CBS 781.70]KAF1817521.1 hypothetical protein P152DRAFT_21995 [Eremomyces bilateralis CBS 781.70]